MDWPPLIALMLFFGFVLLLMEIFVIPGFGPVGIGAIIFLTIGTYLSWVKLSFAWGMTVTLTSVLSVILSIILLYKMGVAKKFVLSRNIGGKEPEDPEGPEKLNSPDVSVNAKGLTLSDLRPSGIAEFKNKRLTVIADGIYIKRNTRIKIIRIEGNRIFVEEE